MDLTEDYEVGFNLLCCSLGLDTIYREKILYKIHSFKILMLLNQMHAIHFLTREPKYRLELFLGMNLINVKIV